LIFATLLFHKSASNINFFFIYLDEITESLKAMIRI